MNQEYQQDGEPTKPFERQILIRVRRAAKLVDACEPVAP